jgi:hypothetical protein
LIIIEKLKGAFEHRQRAGHLRVLGLLVLESFIAYRPPCPLRGGIALFYLFDFYEMVL